MFLGRWLKSTPTDHVGENQAEFQAPGFGLPQSKTGELHPAQEVSLALTFTRM